MNLTHYEAYETHRKRNESDTLAFVVCISFNWVYLCAYVVSLFFCPFAAEQHPAPDFSRHTLIKPKIYHGREKRQISTTREEEVMYCTYNSFSRHLTPNVSVKLLLVFIKLIFMTMLELKSATFCFATQIFGAIFIGNSELNVARKLDRKSTKFA